MRDTEFPDAIEEYGTVAQLAATKRRKYSRQYREAKILSCMLVDTQA
jgi:hypothetical protein